MLVEVIRNTCDQCSLWAWKKQVEMVCFSMLHQASEIGVFDGSDILCLWYTVILSVFIRGLYEADGADLLPGITTYPAVPPLPGATWIHSTLSLLLSFHARVCSRPPFPISRMRSDGLDMVGGVSLLPE